MTWTEVIKPPHKCILPDDFDVMGVMPMSRWECDTCGIEYVLESKDNRGYPKWEAYNGTEHKLVAPADSPRQPPVRPSPWWVRFGLLFSGEQSESRK